MLSLLIKYIQILSIFLFVNFLGHDQVPQTKSVRGSNQCKISFFKRKNKLIILSTIDNLVKGAARPSHTKYECYVWNRRKYWARHHSSESLVMLNKDTKKKKN